MCIVCFIFVIYTNSLALLLLVTEVNGTAVNKSTVMAKKRNTQKSLSYLFRVTWLNLTRSGKELPSPESSPVTFPLNWIIQLCLFSGDSQFMNKVNYFRNGDEVNIFHTEHEKCCIFKREKIQSSSNRFRFLWDPLDSPQFSWWFFSSGDAESCLQLKMKAPELLEGNPDWTRIWLSSTISLIFT